MSMKPEQPDIARIDVYNLIARLNNNIITAQHKFLHLIMAGFITISLLLGMILWRVW